MMHQKLKLIVFCTGIICGMVSYQCGKSHADIYKNGLITVKHEELEVKRNGTPVQFNHPYELSGHLLTNILSNIYYKEKGMFSKKGNLQVFQEDEIRGMTPFIIQALSIATPHQVVSVSSYSERMLLTDQQNYCILFMTGHDLNIVFSRVHMFQTYKDMMSERKGYVTKTENPANIKHSRFWELIPSVGQRLEPGHENWLVIDLRNQAIRQPLAQKAETMGKTTEAVSQELDDRLRKLEERLKYMNRPEQPEPVTSPTSTYHGESHIKAKFVILKELIADGLISEEDYEHKKAKILRESMDGMNIKDQLREMKDLMLEGFITEEDYNTKKKELLDQF